MEQIPSRPIAGKTVLVTGATSGIGKATAQGLATMGAHLAITGRDRRRSEDAVASIAQALGRIDFDDLHGERSYSGARAYNHSKLANIMFTYELARRLLGSEVTANALHPGVVHTSFGAEDPSGIQRLIRPLAPLFMKSPEHGAATSIKLASRSELGTTSGQFFTNSKPKRSSTRSYHQGAAARLRQEAPIWSA
jgi:NAD(P)-dependent dehydrogenase (short-subunit alcohol dehydrogenase family)